MKNRKSTNKKLIWLIIGITILMFSPLLIAFSYQWIMELKGITIHEGNSGIFSIFWLSILTIPIGILLIIIVLAIWVTKNYNSRKKKLNEQIPDIIDANFEFDSNADE